MTVMTALGSAKVACVTVRLRISDDLAVAVICGRSDSLW